MKATAKKVVAKPVKMGGAKEMVDVVIDEKYLASHPDAQAQGFEIGQTIKVPKSEIVEDEETEEVEDEGRSEEDEASMSSEPMGKFYVKSLGDGKFRLYNEAGQAVSPIVSDKEEIMKINKAASRANAINQAKLK